MDVKMVGVKDIAELCGVKPKTVYEWRRRGVLPEAVRIGGHTLRWREDHIQSWINSGCPKSVSEPWTEYR